MFQTSDYERPSPASLWENATKWVWGGENEMELAIMNLTTTRISRDFLSIDTSTLAYLSQLPTATNCAIILLLTILYCAYHRFQLRLSRLERQTLDMIAQRRVLNISQTFKEIDEKLNEASKERENLLGVIDDLISRQDAELEDKDILLSSIKGMRDIIESERFTNDPFRGSGTGRYAGSEAGIASMTMRRWKNPFSNRDNLDDEGDRWWDDHESTLLEESPGSVGRRVRRHTEIDLDDEELNANSSDDSHASLDRHASRDDVHCGDHHDVSNEANPDDLSVPQLIACSVTQSDSANDVHRMKYHERERVHCVGTSDKMQKDVSNVTTENPAEAHTDHGVGVKGCDQICPQYWENWSAHDGFGAGPPPRGRVRSLVGQWEATG